MKRSLLFACFLSSAIAGAAQNQHRCGYIHKLDEARQNDPGVDVRMNLVELQTQQHIQSKSSQKTAAVVTIPVVFHVVYFNSTQNISDNQVLSQLTVLNNDYRRLNADKTNTPSAFAGLAADCEIQFCMAQRDPSNNPTNGIVRKQTSIQQIGNTNSYYQSTNGSVIWDRNKYLNIWVCDIDGGSTLGFAYPPGAAGASFDGVVIDYRYLGTMGTVSAPFDKGRTATHEVGHFLNLRHIWGDDGFNSCSGSDQVSDTPNQANATFGCPNFPRTDNCTTSSPGIMFMNYMDYSDDNCMNMFTAGQKIRMQATLSGSRASLQSSQGCVPVGIKESALENSVKVFPNPGNGVFNVTIEGNTIPFSVKVYNLLGEEVAEVSSAGLRTISFDLGAQPNGVYFAEVLLDGEKVMKKITLAK